MNCYAEREAETKSLRIAINRERESRGDKGSTESRKRTLSFHRSFESKKSSEAHGAGGAGLASWRGHTAMSWDQQHIFRLAKRLSFI